MALAATINEISNADAPNILYIKTLKYIFSITHAICPTREKITSVGQKNFG
jgi:hypothetical protein